MNCSRKTFTIQCSKKRTLVVVVVPFSADQSMFYDLQEFFQVSFQALKHDLNIDVNRKLYSNNCSLLYFGRFSVANTLSINSKVHFPRWRVGHYGILPVRNRSILISS